MVFIPWKPRRVDVNRHSHSQEREIRFENARSKKMRAPISVLKKRRDPKFALSCVPKIGHIVEMGGCIGLGKNWQSVVYIRNGCILCSPKK